jgi:hypothetical protein
MPTGFPQASMGVGRFGVVPPNANAPRGSNPQSAEAAGEPAWYASGPFWVLVFLVVGYILVFQTLKG